MVNKAFYLKKNRMRTFIVIISLLFTNCLFAQELSIGGVVGAGPLNEKSLFSFGTAVEYRPLKSIMSVNLDPFVVISEGKVILTTPLYLKFIIGKKVRFCPSFGGFIRTNAKYGWLGGLCVELCLKKSVLLFVKGDYYKDFWKAEHPTHNGSTGEYIENNSTYWISAGFKIPIQLKHNANPSKSDKKN